MLQRQTEFMAEARYITLTVRYDPDTRYGHSLAWIAPELRQAGLTLSEDHLDDPAPYRTWTGTIDGPTFARFAQAWRLPREVREPRRNSDRMPSYERTLDGMNWETNQASPIISVTLQATPVQALRSELAPARHDLLLSFGGLPDPGLGIGDSKVFQRAERTAHAGLAGHDLLIHPGGEAVGCPACLRADVAPARLH